MAISEFAVEIAPGNVLTFNRKKNEYDLASSHELGLFVRAFCLKTKIDAVDISLDTPIAQLRKLFSDDEEYSLFLAGVKQFGELKVKTEKLWQGSGPNDELNQYFSLRLKPEAFPVFCEEIQKMFIKFEYPTEEAIDVANQLAIVCDCSLFKAILNPTGMPAVVPNKTSSAEFEKTLNAVFNQ